MVWVITGLAIFAFMAWLFKPWQGHAVTPRNPVAIPTAVDAIPFCRGDRTYTHQIVGEASYQAALEQLAGPRTPDGANLKVIATLTPEPSNPHDSKAVRVDIGDHRVGYLSRDDTAEHHNALRRAGLKALPIQCDARIVGGWSRTIRRKKDEGHFGVELDLIYPLNLK